MAQADKELKKGNNIALIVGVGLLLLLILIWTLL